jgi:UDP-N-acetylmuramoyl-L-alanyl-D-glutamate--2,6-diaminopimelate ligase
MITPLDDSFRICVGNFMGVPFIKLIASLPLDAFLSAASRDVLMASLKAQAIDQLILSRLVLDHRKIHTGDVFIALKGEKFDARHVLRDAQHAGAAVVLYEVDPREWGSEPDQMLQVPLFSWLEGMTIPTIGIVNLQKYVSLIADICFEHPSKNIEVIGITGTNGKTSTSHFLADAITALGKRCGVLGTVGNGIWPNLSVATRTTGDPVFIMEMMRTYRDQQVDCVSMEVSSHGLVQHRVSGIPFKTAMFTQLTQDHLDYHGTMESYYLAKKALFEWPSLERMIINVDGPYGYRLANEMKQSREQVQQILVGAHGRDIQLQRCDPVRLGTYVEIHTPLGRLALCVPLIGFFQIYNLLGVLGYLWAIGVNLDQMQRWLLQVKTICGRMEALHHEPLIVIDYAHTPDALEKALEAMRPYVKGTLWVLFGCGGDRDRLKRPLMARVAETKADRVMVSSDNPRTEILEQIFEDIRSGFQNPDQVIWEVSRESAIARVCAQLGPLDGVLLAGKGHERFEERQGVYYPMDERTLVVEAMKKWQQ